MLDQPVEESSGLPLVVALLLSLFDLPLQVGGCFFVGIRELVGVHWGVSDVKADGIREEN